MNRQEEIALLEAKLRLHQQELDSNDGGLLDKPVEAITLAQFNSHAVAVRNKDPLKYAAIQRHIMTEFVASQMIPNVDFGTIPGTDKPGLYKAGAEKLADLFNLRIRIELTNSVEDWDKPLFSYDYKASVYDFKNCLLRECEANCNSWESKYRYRKVWKNKATEQEKALAIGEDGGKIIIPNPDIFNQVNTVKKMSQKRAIVGAVLLAVNASAFFGNMEAELKHNYTVSEDRPTWDVDAEIVETEFQQNNNREELIAIAQKLNLGGASINESLKHVGKEKPSDLNAGELAAAQLYLMFLYGQAQKGLFNHAKHCQSSLNKLITEHPQLPMIEIADLWIQKVSEKQSPKTV